MSIMYLILMSRYWMLIKAPSNVADMLAQPYPMSPFGPPYIL